MDYLVKLLFISGRFLTQVAGRTILQVYYKSIDIHQNLALKYYNMTQMAGSHENMLDLINCRVQDIGINDGKLCSCITDDIYAEIERCRSNPLNPQKLSFINIDLTKYLIESKKNEKKTTKKEGVAETTGRGKVKEPERNFLGRNSSLTRTECSLVSQVSDKIQETNKSSILKNMNLEDTKDINKNEGKEFEICKLLITTKKEEKKGSDPKETVSSVPANSEKKNSDTQVLFEGKPFIIDDEVDHKNPLILESDNPKYLLTLIQKKIRAELEKRGYTDVDNPDNLNTKSRTKSCKEVKNNVEQNSRRKIKINKQLNNDKKENSENNQKNFIDSEKYKEIVRHGKDSLHFHHSNKHNKEDVFALEQYDVEITDIEQVKKELKAIEEQYRKHEKMSETTRSSLVKEKCKKHLQEKLPPEITTFGTKQTAVANNENTKNILKVRPKKENEEKVTIQRRCKSNYKQESNYIEAAVNAKEMKQEKDVANIDDVDNRYNDRYPVGDVCDNTRLLIDLQCNIQDEEDRLEFGKIMNENAKAVNKLEKSVFRKLLKPIDGTDVMKTTAVKETEFLIPRCYTYEVLKKGVLEDIEVNTQLIKANEQAFGSFEAKMKQKLENSNVHNELEIDTQLQMSSKRSMVDNCSFSIMDRSNNLPKKRYPFYNFYIPEPSSDQRAFHTMNTSNFGDDTKKLLEANKNAIHDFEIETQLMFLEQEMLLQNTNKDIKPPVDNATIIFETNNGLILQEISDPDITAEDEMDNLYLQENLSDLNSYVEEDEPLSALTSTVIVEEINRTLQNLSLKDGDYSSPEPKDDDISIEGKKILLELNDGVYMDLNQNPPAAVADEGLVNEREPLTIQKEFMGKPEIVKKKSLLDDHKKKMSIEKYGNKEKLSQGSGDNKVSSLSLETKSQKTNKNIIAASPKYEGDSKKLHQDKRRAKTKKMHQHKMKQLKDESGSEDSVFYSACDLLDFCEIDLQLNNHMKKDNSKANCAVIEEEEDNSIYRTPRSATTVESNSKKELTKLKDSLKKAVEDRYKFSRIPVSENYKNKAVLLEQMNRAIHKKSNDGHSDGGSSDSFTSKKTNQRLMNDELISVLSKDCRQPWHDGCKNVESKDSSKDPKCTKSELPLDQQSVHAKDKTSRDENLETSSKIEQPKFGVGSIDGDNKIDKTAKTSKKGLATIHEDVDGEPKPTQNSLLANPEDYSTEILQYDCNKRDTFNFLEHETNQILEIEHQLRLTRLLKNKTQTLLQNKGECEKKQTELIQPEIKQENENKRSNEKILEEGTSKPSNLCLVQLVNKVLFKETTTDEEIQLLKSKEVLSKKEHTLPQRKEKVQTVFSQKTKDDLLKSLKEEKSKEARRTRPLTGSILLEQISKALGDSTLDIDKLEKVTSKLPQSSLEKEGNLDQKSGIKQKIVLDSNLKQFGRRKTLEDVDSEQDVELFSLDEYSEDDKRVYAKVIAQQILKEQRENMLPQEDLPASLEDSFEFNSAAVPAEMDFDRSEKYLSTLDSLVECASPSVKNLVENQEMTIKDAAKSLAEYISPKISSRNEILQAVNVTLEKKCKNLKRLQKLKAEEKESLLDEVMNFFKTPYMAVDKPMYDQQKVLNMLRKRKKNLIGEIVRTLDQYIEYNNGKPQFDQQKRHSHSSKNMPTIFENETLRKDCLENSIVEPRSESNEAVKQIVNQTLDSRGCPENQEEQDIINGTIQAYLEKFDYPANIEDGSGSVETFDANSLETLEGHEIASDYNLHVNNKSKGQYEIEIKTDLFVKDINKILEQGNTVDEELLKKLLVEKAEVFIKDIESEKDEPRDTFQEIIEQNSMGNAVISSAKTLIQQINNVIIKKPSDNPSLSEAPCFVESGEGRKPNDKDLQSDKKHLPMFYSDIEIDLQNCPFSSGKQEEEKAADYYYEDPLYGLDKREFREGEILSGHGTYHVLVDENNEPFLEEENKLSVGHENMCLLRILEKNQHLMEKLKNTLDFSTSDKHKFSKTPTDIKFNRNFCTTMDSYGNVDGNTLRLIEIDRCTIKSLEDYLSKIKEVLAEEDAALEKLEYQKVEESCSQQDVKRNNDEEEENDGNGNKFSGDGNPPNDDENDKLIALKNKGINKKVFEDLEKTMIIIKEQLLKDEGQGQKLSEQIDLEELKKSRNLPLTEKVYDELENNIKKVVDTLANINTIYEMRDKVVAEKQEEMSKILRKKSIFDEFENYLRAIKLIKKEDDNERSIRDISHKDDDSADDKISEADLEEQRRLIESNQNAFENFEKNILNVISVGKIIGDPKNLDSRGKSATEFTSEMINTLLQNIGTEKPYRLRTDVKTLKARKRRPPSRLSNPQMKRQYDEIRKLFGNYPMPTSIEKLKQKNKQDIAKKKVSRKNLVQEYLKKSRSPFLTNTMKKYNKIETNKVAASEKSTSLEPDKENEESVKLIEEALEHQKNLEKTEKSLRTFLEMEYNDTLRDLEVEKHSNSSEAVGEKVEVDPKIDNEDSIHLAKLEESVGQLDDICLKQSIIEQMIMDQIETEKFEEINRKILSAKLKNIEDELKPVEVEQMDAAVSVKLQKQKQTSLEEYVPSPIVQQAKADEKHKNPDGSQKLAEFYNLIDAVQILQEGVLDAVISEKRTSDNRNAEERGHLESLENKTILNVNQCFEDQASQQKESGMEGTYFQLPDYNDQSLDEKELYLEEEIQKLSNIETQPKICVDEQISTTKEDKDMSSLEFEIITTPNFPLDLKPLESVVPNSQITQEPHLLETKDANKVQQTTTSVQRPIQRLDGILDEMGIDSNCSKIIPVQNINANDIQMNTSVEPPKQKFEEIKAKTNQTEEKLMNIEESNLDIESVVNMINDLTYPEVVLPQQSDAPEINVTEGNLKENVSKDGCLEPLLKKEESFVAMPEKDETLKDMLREDTEKLGDISGRVDRLTDLPVEKDSLDCVSSKEITSGLDEKAKFSEQIADVKEKCLENTIKYERIRFDQKRSDYLEDQKIEEDIIDAQIRKVDEMMASMKNENKLKNTDNVNHEERKDCHLHQTDLVGLTQTNKKVVDSSEVHIKLLNQVKNELKSENTLKNYSIEEAIKSVEAKTAIKNIEPKKANKSDGTDVAFKNADVKHVLLARNIEDKKERNAKNKPEIHNEGRVVNKKSNTMEVLTKNNRIEEVRIDDRALEMKQNMSGEVTKNHLKSGKNNAKNQQSKKLKLKESIKVLRKLGTTQLPKTNENLSNDPTETSMGANSKDTTKRDVKKDEAMKTEGKHFEPSNLRSRTESYLADYLKNRLKNVLKKRGVTTPDTQNEGSKQSFEAVSTPNLMESNEGVDHKTVGKFKSRIPRRMVSSPSQNKSLNEEGAADPQPKVNQVLRKPRRGQTGYLDSSKTSPSLLQSDQTDQSTYSAIGRKKKIEEKDAAIPKTNKFSTKTTVLRQASQHIESSVMGGSSVIPPILNHQILAKETQKQMKKLVKKKVDKSSPKSGLEKNVSLMDIFCENMDDSNYISENPMSNQDLYIPKDTDAAITEDSSSAQAPVAKKASKSGVYIKPLSKIKKVDSPIALMKLIKVKPVVIPVEVKPTVQPRVPYGTNIHNLRPKSFSPQVENTIFPGVSTWTSFVQPKVKPEVKCKQSGASKGKRNTDSSPKKYRYETKEVKSPVGKKPIKITYLVEDK